MTCARIHQRLNRLIRAGSTLFRDDDVFNRGHPPRVTGTSQYQTYGRYTARIKSDTIPNYHAAWLLWPVKDKNGACAESDFPETNLGNDEVTAFAHNAANCKNYAAQDEFDSQTRIDDGAWHTYTQEWGPGFRKY